MNGWDVGSLLFAIKGASQTKGNAWTSKQPIEPTILKWMFQVPGGNEWDVEQSQLGIPLFPSDKSNTICIAFFQKERISLPTDPYFLPLKGP